MSKNLVLSSGKKGNRSNTYNRSEGDSRFLKPVRVIDIILDISHEKAEEYGGYDAIGLIFYADIFEARGQASNIQTNPAKPLYSFIKNYPLKNEVVLLVDAPTKDFYLDRGAGTQYYMPVINIWNHSHNNALPEMPYHLEEGNKEIKETYIGKNIVRNPDVDNGVDVPLGEYFNENLNLQPLLPFEGDLLVEGRFGNSIRLGATAKEAKEKTAYSTRGVTGDPITIIRNGQHVEESDNGWEHTIENINSDHSTIYLTSNQVLPNMEIVSLHWQSWMAKHDELDVGQAIDDFDNLTSGPTTEQVVTPPPPTNEDDEEMSKTSNEDIEADEDKDEEAEGCEDCDNDNPEGEKASADHIEDNKRKDGVDQGASNPTESDSESTSSPEGNPTPPPTQQNNTSTTGGEEVFREGNCKGGVAYRDHDNYEPAISATSTVPQTLDSWTMQSHEGAFNYKGFNITYNHAKDGTYHSQMYQCEKTSGEKYEERSKKAYVYENAGGSDSLSQTEAYIQEMMDDFDIDGYSGFED